VVINLVQKKLGAVKVTNTSFDFDKDDTPSTTATTASLSTDAAMARTFARMDLQNNTSNNSLSTTTTTTSSSSTTKSSSSSSSSSGNDFNKFKNAKAISSDMLFNSGNDAQAREDAARLANFSSARAISSETLFGRGEPNDNSPSRGYGSSSSNSGRYDGRAGSEGLGEFVDKLTLAAGDEVKRLAETMKDRASKVKEGLSIIADAVRR